MNRAPDAGAGGVYLTGHADSLDTATAPSTGLGVGSHRSCTAVTAGTYRVRVTGAGDKTDLWQDVTGLVLASAQVANLVLTGGAGGTVVASGAVSPLIGNCTRVTPARWCGAARPRRSRSCASCVAAAH